MNINANKKTILSDEIAKQIIKSIINKKFKPADKLPNEFELSNEYNVSRPTIREAIKILVSSNIVEIKRGRGTFVTKFPGLKEDPIGLRFIHDSNLLLSLLEARMIIEPGVAYLAAKRAKKYDLERTERCLSYMKGLLEKGEMNIDVEIDFHFSLAEATDNSVIQRIIPIMLESIFYGYTIADDSIMNTINAKKALIGHEKIFNAIKNHKADLAQKEMKNHLEETIHIFKLNSAK